jgi:hypothetical protein
MAVGMMETTDQLLDINTVISHKVPVQCCERLVHVVYRAGIEILEYADLLRLYPTNLRTLVSYDDDGSSSSSISC